MEIVLTSLYAIDILLRIIYFGLDYFKRCINVLDIFMFFLMVFFMTNYVKYIEVDQLPKVPKHIDNIPILAVFLRYALLLVRMIFVLRRYI